MALFSTVAIILLIYWYYSTNKKSANPSVPSTELSGSSISTDDSKKNEYSSDKAYTTKISVVGLPYHSYEAAKQARVLRVSSRYWLKREPYNKYDTNAIAVYVENYMLGYVPAEQASDLAAQLDAGHKFEVLASGYDYMYNHNVTLTLINKTQKRKIEGA